MSARTALFVGGPYHGTLRPLRAETNVALAVPVVQPVSMSPAVWDDPEFMAATPVQYRKAVYTGQRYATAEPDGLVTMEVWMHEDVPSPGYQETLDAALRCLVRAGLLDHRFTDLRDMLTQRTPGELRPELRQRERCTPEPPPLRG